MRALQELAVEHAALRRLADEIGEALGERTGLGWDDRLHGDLEPFHRARRVFRERLLAHEAEEERVIAAALRDRDEERAAFARELERAHSSLNAAMTMLETLSAVCDGEHVHSVRSTARRLREELESHLAYEEEVLFPLFERLAGRRL